ncbi:hypothetical protein E5357_12025 [Hominisplanchenecus murintestinalis]|jgi:hypothetical protein|uniref:Uncharacterized protein n=1 Tax=Hominisplanchenecus murintestinalis TaxID=2941517 RepID=A0AC61QX45_9FIRM|nr:hypothetical protein [Hominisplanchenecus murintestinalis]TGX97558.1 hypothetical protein E5357_12025 [Hominisplanchenecus murintestinalis]
MKQRFLNISIVLVMILVILGGCGSGSASAPAEDSGIATYNAASETQNNSYSETEVYEVEDTYTVDELVTMIMSGELSLDDVYIQVASGEINESEDILYEVENIVAEFEAEKARNASGIVVAKIFLGQQRTWNSTGTFHSTPFTLYLDVINPDTGDVSNFKTFSSMETYSCSPGCYSGAFGAISIGSNTSVTRNYFNSDFTKMIATLTMEDGAIHVGWIDENGQFTDVSAKISHSSEFSGLTNHQKPCFYNDYLYFMDFTNDNVQIKRVPINNLSEASVDILVDDVSWKGVGIYPYPDGSVVDNANAMQEFSDESMNYVANSNFFNDWISTTECVGTDDDIIYKYVLEDKDSYKYFDWYNERIALVPEVKNRKNWNAVVSPDGDRVAFLSKMTGGTDTSTSLFVVSINGGEPMKVNTSYDLSNPNDYSNLVALFDWR